MKPKVSVVIATYNSAHLLPQAIQSVLDQTFADFELIVVDDGSTDHTREVALGIADERIRYIWQKNQERSVARNTGVAASQGDFVTFLDADDAYLPEKLEVQLQALEAEPRLGMALGGWLEVNGDGRLLAERSPWETHVELGLRSWVFSSPTCVGANLLRRSWFDRMDGFDADIVIAEDVDLWFRLARAGCVTIWTKRPVLKVRQHVYHVRDARRLRRSWMRLLDKAYADPEVTTLIGMTKPQSQAFIHCYLAGRFYTAGDAEAAQFDLTQAACLDRRLLDDDAPAFDMLVSWAWQHATADPVQYAHFVLDNLPDAFQSLRRRRGEFFSQAWMVAMFKSYRSQEWTLARKAALEALRYNPFLVRNRGVLSVLASSFLGRFV